MERGHASVSLSCVVLSATGLAIALASALLTAQAQTFVSEALAFRGEPAFRAPPAPPLQSCLGEGQTFGDNDPVRFDLVRCALPRSTDTTTATASSNTSSATQASPTGAPQQGPIGATQPTTSVTHGNPPAVDLGLAYYPPGDLDPHDANRGRKGDRRVYLPNIIFPLRLAPDQHPHMNSQIWGHGGNGWDGKGGAGGSECDPVNYDPMLQRDTYCEIRAWAMPMCPGGTGHQGQDIRPPTCKDNTWEVVAVVDGIITQVTSNTTVRLKGSDGTDYWYLHMHPQSITVKVGQSVRQGDVLGRVSKYMDGDPNGTTMHLHFQVRQNIRVDGKILTVYVPGYTSLIAAYRKAKGLDPGIGPDGTLIVDARFEIGTPKAAPTASSQPSAPVADQSAPSGQPPVPTSQAAQQPPAPAAPSPTADQSTPGGQPSPTASSAAQQPPAPAPSAPVADQSAPSGQAPAPTVIPAAQQPPAPAAPSPAADQSAPGGQPSPPTESSAAQQPPTPAPSAPVADQSAPSGQPPSPTTGPTAQQPPAPEAPSPAANQSAPSGQPSAPTASSTAPQPPSPAPPSPPADQSPAPAASSQAPQPPASTADQASPTSSPMAQQPPATGSVPQPSQSWWQRALSSTKEWWSKLWK